MVKRPREPALFPVFAAILVIAVGLAFWLPGFERTDGVFPVPLDDVYIHYGFARSAALGHPFAWLPENGYSSGGTSLTYPLVLAPAWALGLRGARLSYFAAAITCVCLWDLCRSVRALLEGAPRRAAWIAAPLLLAVPLVDWSLYAGMETALFAGILGRLLVAARRATTASPNERPSAQLRAGLWGALLVATRPESAALVGPLGVAVVYGARSLGTVPSLLRALGPMVFFLAAQASANLVFTGEISQAGAVRKLVGTNPYLTPIEAAVEVIKNLAVLRAQAFDVALGGPSFSFVVPLLALVAAFARRTRLLAIPLVAGAIGMLLLVSLNTTARYQNFRYAVPSLLFLLVAAALGAAELMRRGRVLRALGVGLALVTTLAPARLFPRQIDHFARASGNIEQQQAEVARRLAALSPRPLRVLVGDAGAIPYLSGISALDGLGLGGYHDLPFARASVHGIPAIVELIERMPASERPDVMAIYPGWFPDLARSFGQKMFSVQIEDNVICAAPEKVVYAADWSTLAASDETRAGSVFEVDVADLVDERAHGYTFPRPQAGWVIGATLRDAAGHARFDAGRIIPQGQSESFRVTPHVARGPATLVLRTDGGGPITLQIEHVVHGEPLGGGTQTVEIPMRDEATWFEARVPLSSIGGRDSVKITAKQNAWRSFHAWLVRP
ncbi:hypothetical protein [Polyangium jinanense]|uniref:Uncharacterized protein n=1 Tax=Polyangium jinanense TaxID=2829994 RepID=A0A9X3X5N6_9BACT|nr:hypothetical protein [Polyangium jinanense]MDC3954218.1 hypothetical protein [Polyangium jinanense]MDC3981826.1 hypothetical protein [Polyangium jinanense]